MSSAELFSPTLERTLGDTTTDLGAQDYIDILSLTSDDLRHRSVLDIGSGRTNRFTNEVATALEIERAISINPQLALDYICEERKIDRSAHVGRSVVALAQGFLPFRDSSFDTIVSINGVPKFLYEEELPALLQELWRVLKPDGIAKLWPLAWEESTEQALIVDGNYIISEPLDPALAEEIEDDALASSQILVVYKPPGFDAATELAYLVPKTEQM